MIVLDPARENHLTLGLAREVAAHLGRPVTLTRSGDENPSLAARARHRGRVFVSLHLNDRKSEVWIHPRAGAESCALAHRLGRALRGAVYAGDLGVLRQPSRVAACLVD